jgi:hypothetical protein
MTGLMSRLWPLWVGLSGLVGLLVSIPGH